MDREIARKIISCSYVVGLDVGQQNVGAAEICQGHLRASAFSGSNDFLSRIEVSESVKGHYLGGHKLPDLVVIEEYTKQKFSHVAFGMGENGGVYRSLVWNLDVPILLCPVPLMRSFYGAKRKTKASAGVPVKKAIEVALHNWLCVSSNNEIKRDRENEIEALAYAFIGACYLYWKAVPEVFGEKQLYVLESLDKKYYLG